MSASRLPRARCRAGGTGRCKTRRDLPYVTVLGAVIHMTNRRVGRAAPTPRRVEKILAKTSLQAVLLIAGLGLPLGACSHTASIGAADADSSGDAGSPDASAGDGQSALSVPLRNIDVTVIYPLPSASSLDALLKPSDVGLGGALLAADVFDQGHVPELDARDALADDSARLAAMRAIAIRFDPCPGHTTPPPAGTTCAPEMRLVFQSLKMEGADTTARDGAIHTFHAQSPTEFAAIVRELRDIRAATPDELPVPLGIHPRLQDEGPSGVYSRRLQALVLAHAGPANLVRVTHFRRLSPLPEWQFSIRELVAGKWNSVTIPTTMTMEQHVRTVVGGRWDADITPEITSPDDPRQVLRTSLLDQRKAAFSTVVRVLNPRKHSAQSIDCASCHVAPDIALFASVTMSLQVGDDPDRFQTTYPLAAVPKDSNEVVAFQNLHMASYSGRQLSLSSRAVNETAAVLETINGPTP